MPRLGPASLDVDAVLFDAGGTLLRLDHAFIAARARRGGHAVEPDRLWRAEAALRRVIDRRAARPGGLDDRDAGRVLGYFGALLELAGVPRDVARRLNDEVSDAHREANLWRVPLPGAVETLDALRRRGFRTGVISNADGRVEALLRDAGLAAHCEIVLDSHLEGVEKPDPEIFRRALERLALGAERAVYVGDIYSIDVVGARAAGLQAVLIDETGGYEALDCPVIAGLAELLV